MVNRKLIELEQVKHKAPASLRFNYAYIRVHYLRQYFYSGSGPNDHGTGISGLRKVFLIENAFLFIPK